jgi:hypothetical protein
MATRASGSRTSTSFYLVTARHNVENAERLSDLYLRANLKAGGAEIVRLDGQWHYPDNEDFVTQNRLAGRQQGGELAS